MSKPRLAKQFLICVDPHNLKANPLQSPGNVADAAAEVQNPLTLSEGNQLEYLVPAAPPPLPLVFLREVGTFHAIPCTGCE